MTLEAQVRSELLGSAYMCVRHVSCCVRDGVLTLHGKVPSYFHKQVAQAIVQQRLCGKVPIDNQLRVMGMAG
jgi:osmotically-inducible protein OsmY